MTLFTSLLVCLNFAFGSPASQLSYGELADQTMTEFFELSQRQLQVVDSEVAPAQTKTVRKTIGNTKLMLDIFIFAYPKSGNTDPQRKIRDHLDEGYAVIGDFKDLYDTATHIDEADDNEVRDLRKKVIKWTRKFNRSFSDHRSYLRNPLRGEFQQRKKNDLPKYFWRRIDFRPKHSKTGYQNIKLMCAGVLENARNDLEKLLEIKRLNRYEDEVLFHDARKQIRAVLKVYENWSGMFADHVFADSQFQELDAAVGRFGAINDILVAYHKEEDRGDREDLMDQANAAWKVLRKDLKETKLRRQLKSIISAIETNN